MHVALIHKKLQLSPVCPPFMYKPAEDQPSNFYNWTEFENLSSPQKQTIIHHYRGNSFQVFL